MNMIELTKKEKAREEYEAIRDLVWKIHDAIINSAREKYEKVK